MKTFIPFNSTDFTDKATLISYLNEEQPEELLNFAVALLAMPKETMQKVTLSDIGKTGLLLAITDNQSTQTHFLAFTKPLQCRDDFHTQYLLLIQQSAKILGKPSIQLTQRRFTVLDNYPITANIQRLVLESKDDLSQLPAGYALLLKTELVNKQHSRAVRYYTLRKAWQENHHGKSQNLAWIDIFCHGEKNGEISLGETWVKSLKAGDIVVSEREFSEKIDHLFGKSLLITDETSLPTVARLLELWQNDLPPIVIAFLQSEQELAYLDEVLKEQRATVLPIFADNIITANRQSPHKQIFATISDFLLQNPTQIDSVWGGLEATATNCVRCCVIFWV